MIAWSYATIGNYSKLNPKNCGISRLSSELDTNCWEWHKESFPNLKNARKFMVREAPWIVRIIAKVTKR